MKTIDVRVVAKISGSVFNILFSSRNYVCRCLKLRRVGVKQQCTVSGALNEILGRIIQRLRAMQFVSLKMWNSFQYVLIKVRLEYCSADLSCVCVHY
jgi:hypothetical protein